MVVFKRRKLTSWEAEIDEEYARNDDMKKAIPSTTTRKCPPLLKGKLDRRVILQKNNLFMLAKMSLVFALYYFLVQRNKSLIRDISNTISVLETDVRQMNRQNEETSHELQIVHKHFRDLQRTALGTSSKMPWNEYTQSNNWTRALSDDIIQKHDGQESQLTQLREYVQYYHQLELERRFGPGPYYIEMKLIIKGTPRYMTIQTAPNHLLPHTIYVFMDMVHRKVWNNTIFLHQWNHKIQAKRMPPSTTGNSPAAIQRSMELSIIEYSEEYPHEAYTVGLSGRLDASEIFINLENNDAVYGNGEHDDRVVEDAYPCFAKVVIGKSTLALLNRATAEAMKNGPDGMIVTVIESMKTVKLSKSRLKELGVLS
mmetsp:Transcript_8754/g.16527  ORF Transcript_8754/g.16527 Transcript_8754/m.16527 type:complete len:370 (-) Transcript_8754:50-1159(-)